MREMTIAEICSACGGTLLSGDAETRVTYFSIDSRDVPEGTFFVPLIGERVDAHKFLGDVREKGALGAFTSEGNPFAGEAGDTGKKEMALIAVPDTVKALQDVGALVREQLQIPIAAVTGSVGKTTTRELTAAAFSAKYRTFKTPNNNNGQLGVPLTMMKIGEEDQFAVIEMGMSIPGEMTKISKVARPDAVVFTNVGDAHIEQLGSRENILREKLHIQDYMPEGSVMFLNGDDPLLRNCTLREGFRKVLYGTTPDCDFYAEDIRLENGCALFTAVTPEGKVPVALGVYGEHQVLNAMAALTAAVWFGADPKKAAEKMGEFRGYKHRQQIIVNNGLVIVDDSYNASPVSMKAGLGILKSLTPAGRKIAVLGDMKELGEAAEEMHREVGTFLAEQNAADWLFVLGPLGKQLAEGARKAGFPGDSILCFTDREELGKELERFAKEGDAILFKASNSMKLFELADRMGGNAK
ncbi:MAG: UDP-N-acetylmuramoyl-tripeptide--D-alanyl-D-alanine ligase [Stomatobaculum sp.]|nr:UDP-N-acetylmuramoyl-tripeptide--D-alanyl-D-alanine ligase [Stomatobaculum sp.]